MKARAKFIRMFTNLPEKARRELVLNPYGNKPLSLAVVYWEVKCNSDLGKQCLKELGYVDTSSVHKESKNV